MNTEKYIVRLSEEERQELQTIVKKRKETSQKVKRAIVLLKADVDGPNWTNEKIHELTGVSVSAISRMRKQLVTEGFEATIHRKKRMIPPREKNGTDSRKRSSLPCDAARHRKALVNGHSDFLPTKWSSSKSRIPSVPKP